MHANNCYHSLIESRHFWGCIIHRPRWRSVWPRNPSALFTDYLIKRSGLCDHFCSVLTVSYIFVLLTWITDPPVGSAQPHLSLINETVFYKTGYWCLGDLAHFMQVPRNKSPTGVLVSSALLIFPSTMQNLHWSEQKPRFEHLLHWIVQEPAQGSKASAEEYCLRNVTFHCPSYHIQLFFFKKGQLTE